LAFLVDELVHIKPVLLPFKVVDGHTLQSISRRTER
jgi:hypothetical protein